MLGPELSSVAVAELQKHVSILRLVPALILWYPLATAQARTGHDHLSATDQRAQSNAKTLDSMCSVPNERYQYRLHMTNPVNSEV